MDALNKALKTLKDNPYASTGVTIFLSLYAGLAAPNLPPRIAGLFEHSLFKLLINALILVFLLGHNYKLAILVAIGFVVSMHTLSKYRIFAMAQDLTGLNLHTNPDGRSPRGNIEEAQWGAKDGINRTKLRGFEYVVKNETNLLPGGHGDMKQNAIGADKVLKSQLKGYTGHSLAIIGTPESQL